MRSTNRWFWSRGRYCNTYGPTRTTLWANCSTPTASSVSYSLWTHNRTSLNYIALVCRELLIFTRLKTLKIYLCSHKATAEHNYFIIAFLKAKCTCLHLSVPLKIIGNARGALVGLFILQMEASFSRF